MVFPPYYLRADVAVQMRRYEANLQDADRKMGKVSLSFW